MSDHIITHTSRLHPPDSDTPDNRYSPVSTGTVELLRTQMIMRNDFCRDLAADTFPLVQV
jgi:hypothetical protein